MIKSSEQFDFLDFLAVMSFMIGLWNLDENVSQGDIQNVMQELAEKADMLLTEIHGHLEEQDRKIDELLRRTA